MITQSSTQSQDSGKAGIEIPDVLAEVDEILASIEPLYSEEVQESTEDVLKTLDRLLSTGSFALEDVSNVIDLEELQKETLKHLEEMRTRIADLRARL
jgi:hypothetical protein